jgi:hypothetical protein
MGLGRETPAPVIHALKEITTVMAWEINANNLVGKYAELLDRVPGEVETPRIAKALWRREVGWRKARATPLGFINHLIVTVDNFRAGTWLRKRRRAEAAKVRNDNDPATLAARAKRNAYARARHKAMVEGKWKPGYRKGPVT